MGLRLALTNEELVSYGTANLVMESVLFCDGVGRLMAFGQVSWRQGHLLFKGTVQRENNYPDSFDYIFSSKTVVVVLC